MDTFSWGDATRSGNSTVPRGRDDEEREGRPESHASRRAAVSLPPALSQSPVEQASDREDERSRRADGKEEPALRRS